ncbi:MAG: hypothetical protein AAFX99_31345, partial [Myxococcota bacterium]
INFNKLFKSKRREARRDRDYRNAEAQSGLEGDDTAEPQDEQSPGDASAPEPQGAEPTSGGAGE